MKLESTLVACALAALPFAALAQQQPAAPRRSASDISDMNVTTMTGTVQAYEAGRSIRIKTENGEEKTFNLPSSVDVPRGVAVGRTVSVRTTNEGGVTVVRAVSLSSPKSSDRKPY